jgi:hypothetical protein
MRNIVHSCKNSEQQLFAAARVAKICTDTLSVVGGVPSSVMYSDPLGTLEGRLRGLVTRNPELPGLAEFLRVLPGARKTRNDLLHALPDRDGLRRRKTDDPHYVRTFYSIEDVEAATREIDEAWRSGHQVLYADDGAAVYAWGQAFGTFHVHGTASGRADQGNGEPPP